LTYRQITECPNYIIDISLFFKQKRSCSAFYRGANAALESHLRTIAFIFAISADRSLSIRTPSNRAPMNGAADAARPARRQVIGGIRRTCGSGLIVSKFLWLRCRLRKCQLCLVRQRSEGHQAQDGYLPLYFSQY
jgi:hypothetical protein